MNFETYVTGCMLGLLLGDWIILLMLWNLNSRLIKLEKKLNTEDEDGKDPEDKEVA